MSRLLPQAKDWDSFWSKEGDIHLSWSKKRILNILEKHLKTQDYVLDAGCGSGFFSAWFSYRGARVTSLDYSQRALDRAKEVTKGKAILLKADLLKESLVYKVENKFNLIFSDGLFEHFTWQDQDIIMQNLKSVLASDGLLVTFVPNRWSPWELIRPFWMPGIQEKPFIKKTLIDLHQRNQYQILDVGGINTLPFRFSPEIDIVSRVFGMLLYVVAKH